MTHALYEIFPLSGITICGSFPIFVVPNSNGKMCGCGYTWLLKGLQDI